MSFNQLTAFGLLWTWIQYNLLSMRFGGGVYQLQHLELELVGIQDIVFENLCRGMMTSIGYVASRQLGQMLIALLFFHVSEFALALIIHGASNVSLTSFLISKHYCFAMICGIIEYAIEIILVPDLKMQWWLSNVGLVMVVTGELVRKTGILTARRSFTHDIKIYLREDHALVTYGIYRFIRHPGYSGFFMWSIGTQVMLCNPLCAIAYAVITWRFFANRIPYEEFYLRQFFGAQYEEYAQRVPSGIPFIK